MTVTSQAALATPLFSDPDFSPITALTLLQVFVVGNSFCPIPVELVSQITLGKFVELSELSPPNITSPKSEPQLLFDGRLVLTSAPTKAKRRIEDIVTWMEVFLIISLVLATRSPLRRKDFGNRVCLAYD